MQHSEVINRIAERLSAKSYLEIGVETGVTFRKVTIADKVGVDPDLKVDPSSLDGVFYSNFSDAFFEKLRAGEIERDGFDVIFIDGLHTFEQSLRDLLNAIEFLRPGGVIVIDDVRPTDALAALRSHQRCRELKERVASPDRNWMGDVFKTIAFLHDYLLAFDYATTSGDTAVTVLWRSSSVKNRSPKFTEIGSISALNYVDLLEDDSFLKPEPFDQILSKIPQA